MIRKAFVIHAKGGKVEEYIRHHNPIWTELKEQLQQHGVTNYSIFYREGSQQLFGYLEVGDEALFEKLAEQEVCRRWWLLMTSFLECENESSTKAKEEMLTEVFHLQ